MSGAIEDLDAFSRLPMEDIYSRYLEMALQVEELQESRSEYEAELEAEISQANLEAKLAKLETEALSALLERHSAQAEQQKNELNARIRAAEFNRAELTQSVQTLTKRTVNLERKQEQLDELNRALKQQLDDKTTRLEELEDEIALIGSDLSDRVHELEIANNDLWKARQRRRLTFEGQLPNATPGRKKTDGDGALYKEMVAKLELESIVDDLKSAQEKVKSFEELQARNSALENEVRELRAQLAEDQARQTRLEEDAKLRDSVRLEQLKQAESDQSEVMALRTAIEERAQAKQELEILTNLVAAGSSNEADNVRLGELKEKLDAQTRERNKAVARRKQNRLMNPHVPPPSMQPRGSQSSHMASLSPSLSFFAQGLRSNLLERRFHPKAPGDDLGQGRPDLFKIRFIYVVQNTFPNSECKTIQISKAMTSFQKLLETVTKTFVFDAGPCRRLYFIDQDKETFTKLDRLDRVEDRAHYLAVGPEPFNPTMWDLATTPRNCFHCDGKNHISATRRMTGQHESTLDLRRGALVPEEPPPPPPPSPLAEPRPSLAGLTMAALGALTDINAPPRRRGSGASDASNASRASVSSNSNWGLPRALARDISTSAMFSRKLTEKQPTSPTPVERVSPAVTANAAAVAVAAAAAERGRERLDKIEKVEVIPDLASSPRLRSSGNPMAASPSAHASARARVQGHRALSLPFPVRPPPPPSSPESQPSVSASVSASVDCPSSPESTSGASEDRPKTLSPPDGSGRFEMKRSGSRTRLAFGKLVPATNSSTLRARSRSPKPSKD